MSKIDELIQELCPDGVQILPLKEIVTHLRTGLNPRSNFSLNGPGAYGRYVTVRELAGFSIQYHPKTDRLDSDGLRLIQARSQLKQGDVLFSGTGTIGRTALVSVEPSDWNIKEGVYALTPRHELMNSRFLVYLLQSGQIRQDIMSKSSGSTVQSIPFSALEKVKLPVPPFEVQREIVSILDKFTQLEAELEAELGARRAQYEVAQHSLFALEDKSEPHPLGSLISRVAPGGVTSLEIGQFATCVSGATPSSGVGKFWDGGAIPWMSSGEVNKLVVTDTDKKITQSGYDSCSTKMVPAGTVVMALAGQGKTRGMVAITGIELCTNQSLCSIICDETVLPDYLYHFLRSQYLALRSMSSGDGGRGGLNLQIVRGFKVPVPTLEIQAEIIAVLGKLDALVNDISSGLPAEIAARRKQYEYYRNKLLTFKELETA